MTLIGDIVTKIRDVADRNPDRRYVYPGPGIWWAEYVTNGAPASLDGFALWELGIIDASIEADPVMNHLGIKDFLITRKICEESDPKLPWLRWVTYYQDRRDRWSSCVANADSNTSLGLRVEECAS